MKRRIGLAVCCLLLAAGCSRNPQVQEEPQSPPDAPESKTPMEESGAGRLTPATEQAEPDSASLPTPEEELAPPEGQEQEIASARRSQVGTGDRSERIRTYNFPQGRVTDHRIGLTLYKIDAVMDGDLAEITDALITADQAEKLRAQGET